MFSHATRPHSQSTESYFKPSLHHPSFVLPSVGRYSTRWVTSHSSETARVSAATGWRTRRDYRTGRIFSHEKKGKITNHSSSHFTTDHCTFRERRFRMWPAVPTRQRWWSLLCCYKKGWYSGFIRVTENEKYMGILLEHKFYRLPVYVYSINI